MGRQRGERERGKGKGRTGEMKREGGRGGRWMNLVKYQMP